MPTFDWQTLANADQYQLEVEAVESSWDRDYFTVDSDFAWPLSESLSPATDYTWRVRALSTEGDSDWSASRSFRTGGDIAPGAPILVGPINGESNVPLSATLNWLPGMGVALFYDVQISRNAEFTDLAYDVTNYDNTELTVPIMMLIADSDYWWKVRGGNNSGLGSYSTIFQFRTVSTPTEIGGVVWSTNFNETANSCPVFDVNGDIYINSGDDLVKIDKNSGTELWRLDLFCREELEHGPTISHNGETIYSIADNGSFGEPGNDFPHLASIDMDGNVNWYTTLPGIDAYKPTLDSSGNIYITLQNLEDADAQDVIVSYNSSGVERWRRAYPVDGNMSSPPAVRGETVVFARKNYSFQQINNDGQIIALSTSNGNSLWIRSIGASRITTSAALAFANDAILFGESSDNQLHRINTTNGNYASGWPINGLFDNVDCTVLVDEAGNTYAGTDDNGSPEIHFWYSHTSSGIQRWSHSIPSNSGKCAVMDDSGILYTNNSTANTVFAINKDTGELNWSMNLGIRPKGLSISPEGLLVLTFYSNSTASIMAIETGSTGLADGFWPVTFHDYHGSGCYDAPQPIGSPINLVCSQGTFADHVSLSWQMNAPSDHVEIFRSTDNNSNFSLIGNSANGEFNDMLVQPGEHYCYKLRNSLGGNTGPFVPTIGVEGWALDAVIPSLLSVSRGEFDTGIEIQWETLEGADSYNVYWSDSQSGLYERVATSIYGNSYFDVMPLYGLQWYRITANYGQIESGNSIALSGWRKLSAPSLEIEVLVGSVVINWDPIGWSVIYEVHRSTDPYFTPNASTLFAEVTSPYFVDLLTEQHQFYSVVAKMVIPDSLQNFVLISSGQFLMGQAGVATPEHSVILSRDYLLGQTEVTNTQYLEALNWAKSQGLVSVVGDYVQQYGENLLCINESGFDRYEIRYNQDTQEFNLHIATWDAGNYGPGAAYPNGSYDPADHPVKYVSWYGAACYCDWRSQMENLPRYYQGQWEHIPYPNDPYNSTGYRLPTEAEWEFAAQWEDERTYPWADSGVPDCGIANYSPNSPLDYCKGWTTPVGSFPSGASALGLMDMAGNVYEWCNDRWGDYSAGEITDPPGPSTGSLHVKRGGGCFSPASYLRNTYRSGNPSSDLQYTLGFRLCRTVISHSDGPVAFYPFSGSALDASGNGHDGTVSGALELTSDRFGNQNSAYDFNGANTYITVPHHADFILDRNLSLSVWFKRDIPSVHGFHQRFLSKWEIGSNPARHEYVFGLDYQSSNHIWGAVGQWQNSTESSDAPDTQWHHAVFTSDDTGVFLYLDGVLESQGPHSTAHTTGNFNPLFIGGGASSSPMPVYIFDGRLDDIRIYDRAITAQDVLDLYHEGGWMVDSQIQVISPAGGESWAHGTTHEITWTDNLYGSVRIELWDGNRLETYIAPSTESDGSFIWTMTSGYVPSSNYRVRIVALDDLMVQDESEFPFTITD